MKVHYVPGGLAGAAATIMAVLSLIRDSHAARFLSGPDPRNWTHYHDFNTMQAGDKTTLFDLALHNAVDSPDLDFTLRACTTSDSRVLAVTRAADALAAYVEADANCQSTVMFARSGEATIGVYVGTQVDRKSAADVLLESFIAQIKSSGSPARMGAQACGDQALATQIVSIFADADDDLGAVQDVVRGWSDAQCPGVLSHEETHPRCIAASHTTSVTAIQTVNKQTWGWSGCLEIQPGQLICPSKWDPLMPNSISNTRCGPQVPSTVRPTNGTKLADLNPCPLMAADIPSTPSRGAEEGQNYYKFLQAVEKLLPVGKSLSIATTISFWCLQKFPVNAMTELLDYIWEDEGDIIVYDSTEWLSWLCLETYILRRARYYGLHFGGPVDWAVDLGRDFGGDGKGAGEGFEDVGIEDPICDFTLKFDWLDALKQKGASLN
ncbi:hypothetical protein B0H67DRAFT_682014 [Lasiosphaeris hirsuta]|uniref:Uncharacterized protein n=1 Tax=Lasiosphaeris hirsuta TaxID=260670 RepID=A0AA40AQC2_9PEZI|nr:hypothetical protein B0H67DRAFT_682014 [Lasiosphaeris hirsuta]